MESGANVLQKTLVEEPSQSWVWLGILSIALGVLWYFLTSAVDIAEIQRDWPKYRCNPAVMPFASLYGYDATDNFNYCLKNMFQLQTGAITGPFGSILSVIVQNMMTFLESLNNIRVMIATFIGGISKLTQEFVDRFKLLFAQVKVAGVRLQMLFRRTFATFFAVIYMGMSGITAGLNFGDTVIFKFIDTFCFAPETYIEVRNKGKIQIQNVQLGDVLAKNDATVMSTYRFMADGQPMVYLDDIEVSTNHYVKHQGQWIQAKDYPNAWQNGVWSGGMQRPLICLDTDNHTIPIKDYIFSDWDETSESDEATMILAEKRLNGGNVSKQPRNWLYQPAFAPDTLIKTKERGRITAERLSCGDILLNGGRVTGIGRRYVNEWLVLPTGETVTPSTLLWTQEGWVRAGHLYPTFIVKSNTPKVMVTAVVMGDGILETSTGIVMRDMCEVHSPDMESLTTAALDPTKSSCEEVLSH
jgi:hypothetical protein